MGSGAIAGIAVAPPSVKIAETLKNSPRISGVAFLNACETWERAAVSDVFGDFSARAITGRVND